MVKQVIVLAGGCFWGVEELLRQVPGVTDTEVGYIGGKLANPTYETVKTGSTGHAEAIRVEFDPQVIPLDDLLDLFFKLHDPTTLNRQGNDIGTQYRSAIFADAEEQRTAAFAAIERAQQSGRWGRKISTSVEPLSEFFSAEGYHQDYLQKNPNGYNCHFWRD